MGTIDSVDEQIVRLLGQDARQNSETLAKKLKLSSATVRRRLRKLIRSDLLRIVGVVDPASFGFPLLVVITLDVAHEKLESAMEKLSQRPEIIFVSAITGRYDMILIGRFRSAGSLSGFVTKELAKIEGVKNSETFVCLGIKKMSRTTLTGLS
jgi:Lrp/AsnC family transcriptional regulator, regulator for asnA, asnC and gidA